ncbi:hypothetical protein OOZ15_01915 [Galbibacter sp. EGI 63066]|uniref:hypothetical protein n=1 Tax=Galbibacter sp. EGI 63066 TaxID=2993559 RepID=UPI0022497A37|nr:hypothetical protein [Galbibacter sp. EGI 63066]MCX2678686.1 hypothetical protein [Galbibacter sp. EGI 63066]
MKIKMMKNNTVIWGIMFLCLCLISCEYNVEEDDFTGTSCDPNLSFSDVIRPIIDDNCIQCHNGTIHPYDFRIFSIVQENAETIKQLTQARIMPKEGSLTSQEIDQIACWVENGAQNN